MRNDQLPEQTAESERTPNRRNPGFMDFTPLAVLQQRLNELERNYGNLQNFHDDSILASRIARVAPMSAGPDNARRRLPSISYQASAAFDISAFHLQNPTAVTFSNAAAAVAAASDDAAMRSTVRVASNSASYSTASANTATYSSSPIRNSSAPPSLYRIASTTAFYGAGSSSNSETESDISTETASISEHDYDVIPPFRRRALALDINDAAVANAAARRRALDEDEDEDMDEDPVPRKHAKRSMHHVTVVNRFGGNGSGSGGNGSGSGGNGSGFGGNGSGFGGNGSGSGGNGSGVGGNGSGVGGNGGDDMMDCEL